MLCECGCGQETNLITETNRNLGRVKGQPNRFVYGHQHNKLSLARRNVQIPKMVNGYKALKAYGHPKVHGRNTYVYEHVLVAEKALGRYLINRELVHHVNDVKTDNRNKNLVICPDDAYHKLLHMRAAAYRATGNPHARRCEICRDWIMPEDPDRRAYTRRTGQKWTSYFHGTCYNQRSRDRRRLKKAV